MEQKKLVPYGVTVLGGVVTLVGIIFVFMYFYEGVVIPWGNADQSLIFWYLPILFIGFVGIGFGLAALFWSVNRLKSPRK